MHACAVSVICRTSKPIVIPGPQLLRKTHIELPSFLNSIFGFFCVLSRTAVPEVRFVDTQTAYERIGIKNYRLHKAKNYKKGVVH
jgi:hypothetical protein